MQQPSKEVKHRRNRQGSWYSDGRNSSFLLLPLAVMERGRDLRRWPWWILVGLACSCLTTGTGLLENIPIVSSSKDWTRTGLWFTEYMFCNLQQWSSKAALTSRCFTVMPGTQYVLFVNYSAERCPSKLCGDRLIIRRRSASSCSDLGVPNQYYLSPERSCESLSECTLNFDVPLLAAQQLVIELEWRCFVLHDLRVEQRQCQADGRPLMIIADPTLVGINSSRVEVRCSKHAVKSKDFGPATCYNNGTVVFQGRCVCTRGYRYLDASCYECSPWTYKALSGNTQCLPCGEGTDWTPTHCNCKENHFRLISAQNSSSSPCYRPPSPPLTIAVTEVGSLLTITWSPPSRPGNYGNVTYDIDISPKLTTINSTFLSGVKLACCNFTVIGLGGFMNYTISVVAHNNLTRDIQYKAARTKLVYRTTTRTAPSPVLSARLHLETRKAFLSWPEPLIRGGPELVYIVYMGESVLKTNATSVVLTEEFLLGSKMVKIIAVADHLQSIPLILNLTANFTEEFMARALPGGPSGLVKIILYIVVPVVVILVCLFFLLVVIRRRSHQNASSTPLLRLDHSGDLDPSSNNISGTNFVDPWVFDQDSYGFHIPVVRLEWLTIGNLIGAGHFANVYKGLLVRPESQQVYVAVKVLKPEATNVISAKNFYKEAVTLAQFNHPNIVRLEGIVAEGKVMILTEYLQNGSLDVYLRNNHGKLSLDRLLRMAICIAEGMEYLSGMGFVHRDLAARNILVTDDLTCKVSDFGLTRGLSADLNYNSTAKDMKLPIRWTSPESMRTQVFTTASDIWSFGIVLWEITSFGDYPYPMDLSGQEIIERLNGGWRLPQHKSCNVAMYDLMIQCWSKEPAARPSFGSLRSTLESWRQHPERMLEQKSYASKSAVTVDYSQIKTVDDWLRCLNLEDYAEGLRLANVVTADDITRLTPELLEQLGVRPQGHRNKMDKSVAAMRAFYAARQSDQMV